MKKVLSLYLVLNIFIISSLNAKELSDLVKQKLIECYSSKNLPNNLSEIICKRISCLKPIDINIPFGIPQCKPVIQATTILKFNTCQCSFPANNPASIDLSQCPHPEGIIYGIDEHLYITLIYRAQILRIQPDGSEPEIYASLPQPINSLQTGQFSRLTGLTQNKKGDIFVCYADSRAEVNGIWKVFRDRVESNGQHASIRIFALPVNSTGFVPAANFVNGITLDSAEQFLYVTDSALGLIYKIDSNNINKGSIWSNDPLLQGDIRTFDLVGRPIGVNGIDIDDLTAQKFIYVTVTGSGGTIPTGDARGRLVRIPILPNGSAGIAELLFEEKVLWGSDGAFFDKDQRILYWANSSSDATNYAVPAILALAVDQTPLQFKIIWSGRPPAFGCSDVIIGKGKDKNKLFATNFDFIGHFSLFSPVCAINTNVSPGDPGIISLIRMAAD